MPTLTLDLDDIVVESFATEMAPATGADVRPRTFEPGCTRDFCRAGDVL
jgi:hypothetical protein